MVGFDQEGKGRSTYMALTGAYRQALIQIFSIPTEDEFSQSNNNEHKLKQDEQDEFEDFSSLDEFQESEANETPQVVNSKNLSSEDIRNHNINVDEITVTDIDNEFANF